MGCFVACCGWRATRKYEKAVATIDSSDFIVYFISIKDAVACYRDGRVLVPGDKLYVFVYTGKFISTPEGRWMCDRLNSTICNECMIGSWYSFSSQSVM